MKVRRFCSRGIKKNGITSILLSLISKRIIRYKRQLISFFRRIRYNINPSIMIGKGTLVDRDVSIKTVLGSSHVKIGISCEIRKGVILVNDCGGFIEIGDHTSINPYTILYGHGGLTIGDGVRIAAHTMIVTFNHRFDGPEYIFKQGITRKGVTIEDNVWIGGGAKILDGVIIRKGCIIGAGSVVTKSTEPNAIYGGIPAKLIRFR